MRTHKKVMNIRMILDGYCSEDSSSSPKCFTEAHTSRNPPAQCSLLQMYKQVREQEISPIGWEEDHDFTVISGSKMWLVLSVIN